MIGVVIVSYNCREALTACLASLRVAAPDLTVVVVDNASTDGTVDGLGLPEIAATGTAVPQGHCLVRAPFNSGYAGGVNLGLQTLARLSDIDWFWVLNPDMELPPASFSALQTYLAENAPGGFVGGRVRYHHAPNMIQTDGGRINFSTGITRNVHLGELGNLPLPDGQSLHFVMGGNMVLSRGLLAELGPMCEDYFLFYEECDWAMRAREPIAIVPGFELLHRAGASIGSPRLDRAASPLSLYFRHRARIMFLRRFAPRALPVALGWSLAKAAQMALRGQLRGAVALLSGSFGLRPPKPVRDALSAQTLDFVFADKPRENAVELTAATPRP